MANEWHGRAYDRITAPHAAQGAEALDRLMLRGDERVLDAGCGSGRVTELLLERLPRGSVVALDASTDMLDAARVRLQRFGERVTYLQADLAEPTLPVEDEFDGVLSTAVFHWILDHPTLFRSLAAVMRHGAQLSFKCGGEGNVDEIIEAVRDAGVETSHLYTFASPDETRERLTAAGFVDVDTWLSTESVHFDSVEELEAYLIEPYLRPATGLPDVELHRLAAAVVDRLDERAIHYVRLNAIAHKG